MRKKPTNKEITDALTEKLLSETDKLISACSDAAHSVAAYKSCPRNPLDISNCNERTKKYKKF